MSILQETTVELREVCRKLGRTYGTVKRWTETPGENGLPLEAIKLGGSLYTSWEALGRYGKWTAPRTTATAKPSAEKRFLAERYGFGKKLKTS